MMGRLKIAGLLLVLPVSLAYTQQDDRIDQQCRTEDIAPTAPPARFQQNEDGTVVDKETGLMWRTCAQGVTGDACDEGEPVELNWAEALLHVPAFNGEGGFAGHEDWRLPNIRELSTLVELQCVSPALDRTVFPNAAVLPVWSSSPAGFHAHYSWYVDFDSGAIAYGDRTKAKALRLVRDSEKR